MPVCMVMIEFKISNEFPNAFPKLWTPFENLPTWGLSYDELSGLNIDVTSQSCSAVLVVGFIFSSTIIFALLVSTWNNKKIPIHK